jgi:hypothetical protein
MTEQEPEIDPAQVVEPQPLDLENYELSKDDIEALSVNPFENYTPPEPEEE